MPEVIVQVGESIYEAYKKLNPGDTLVLPPGTYNEKGIRQPLAEEEVDDE